MSYINFESARVKEAERAEKKKAREGILKKAEEDYYRKKQKEEQARLRGDDKWILPSVEARIKGDKDKEKKKKHKKKKKKAKKKRKSSSSDSDDDSEDEEWVEKGVDVPSKTGVGTLSEQNGKKTDPLSSGKETEKKSISEQSQEKSKVPTERDEWMTLPGLFPSVSREQLRQQSGRLSKAEEQRQKDRYMLDNLGQSDRELNPYWKDGGTGLPQEEEHERGKKELHSLPAKAVGDQGVDWLRRALKRAKEQAAEEGRTLEEVAAERWGSLEKLETLIAEAEEKSGRQRKQGSNQREYDKYEQESRRNSWKKNTHDTDGTRKPDSERRSARNDQDRISSSSRSFHKPREDDSPHRHRDSSESTSRSFRTPDDRDEEVGCSKRDWNSERHSKRSFQKPGEDIDLLERGDFRIHEKNVPDSSKYRSSASSGNWRKKTSGDQKVYVGSNKPKDVKSSKKAESSSSSPSSDDDGNEEEKKGEESAMLTDKEMNDLGAKLVKAEILGNETLAKELKKKLDAARAVRTMKPKETSDTKSAAKDEEETVVLTRTDSKGFIHPIKQTGQHTEPVGGRRRKQKMETHVDGKRVRYFADDDKYSLKDLFEREKLSTARDEEEMISKLAGKVTDNDDMDDIFAERVRQKESDGKIQARERSQAIKEHKIVDRVLENCNWCFDSKAMLKHLIVAIGNKAYLCLPPHQSLTEGHCFIMPMYHVPCATQLDEDVWSELQTFRKTLTKMFREKFDQDVIFFETAMYLRKFPHMMLECVPVPQEIGDLAPIYFKKAILECETEWATNKKLVDLSGKDVRRAVPKELPYFAVDFGLDSGFAHVIEDEKMFPRNFAQEIIGGMMDLDHSIWRKQRRENFDLQRKKVMQFSQWWKSYDFTTAKQEDSSDSD